MFSRVKEIRDYLGLSQATFAAKVNTSAALISDIENGRRTLFNPLIDKICTVFCVNKEWLQDGTGSMFNTYQPQYEEKHIGERIKTVRKEHGLTQKKFAEQIFCTYETVYRVERGNVIPSEKWLQKVAEVFDVSMQWLLTGEETAQNVVDKSVERIGKYLRENESARIAITEAINSGDDGIWSRIEQLVKEQQE